MLFITEDDPLYVIRFFETFFEEYPRDRIEVVGVTVERPFNEPLWRTARRMLDFYRPATVVRIGARYVGAKMRRRSIQRLAAREGIPLVAATSVNDDTYLAEVCRLSPDVIVSVAAPEIFRKPLLSLARLGCINVHSGRLPAYRGMMPTFWQMASGESFAEVTVHEMVEKLDAGGVLGTSKVPIHGQDSLDRVMTCSKQEAARLMVRVLDQIRCGTTHPRPLDIGQGGYFRFPKPSDVGAFLERGHRFI